MRLESVDAPSLLELRAIVAQRLRMYGSFEGCTPKEQRTAGIEGRLMYLTHLDPPADGVRYQTVLDTMARLCPDVIAAVQGYFTVWRARFWQDNWHLIDVSV
jgi:hypothetical protein